LTGTTSDERLLKSEAIAKQGEVNVIVGLSGKKGSGKSTVAGYLHRHMDGALRLPFAFRLKEIAQECFGAEAVQVNGDESQKNTLTQCGLTGRELMQRIGHDLREIWPDCWVRAWETEVVAMWAEAGAACPIIVEDVRYRNEVEVIRKMGGIVIRLTRAPHQDFHDSEVALDDYEDFDAVILDGLTVDETCAAVMEVCRDQGVV
jgi:hypothetical protein